MGTRQRGHRRRMGHIKTGFSERALLMLPNPRQAELTQHTHTLTHARSCSLLAPIYDRWPVCVYGFERCVSMCGWCHRLSSSRTTTHPTWKVACHGNLTIFFPCSPIVIHHLVWLLVWCCFKFVSTNVLYFYGCCVVRFGSSVMLKIDGVDRNECIMVLTLTLLCPI